jgi:hypothetical protein
LEEVREERKRNRKERRGMGESPSLLDVGR